MSIPKYYEMHRPLLQFLSDGKPHTVKELKLAMVQYFHLSESELAELLPSGRQTYFANRLAWARTYLKKAGLIENSQRGICSITPEGRNTLLTGPEVITSEYLSKFDSFNEFTSSSAAKTPYIAPPEITPKLTYEKKDTPDDILENAFAEVNQRLADEILSEVMKLSPIAFEKMVLDLMSKMGYGTFSNASKMTSTTGDEGIDGIIMEDKLGFDLIYVQVKHWAADHLVGRPDVQAFVGAIAGKGGKGLFVTTSGFSVHAVEYAKKQHIILMDGEKLAKNMIEYNFGVSTKKIFEIKNIDTDIFDEYQDM